MAPAPLTLGQSVVGPYDTVQLQSTNPNALNAWLTELYRHSLHAPYTGVGLELSVSLPSGGEIPVGRRSMEAVAPRCASASARPG